MRARPLIWFALGVIGLVGVLSFWRLAHRPTASPQGTPPVAGVPGVVSHPHRVATPSQTTVVEATAPEFIAGSAGASKVSPTNHLAHRLTNTTKTVGQLLRDDHAVLLENALIDTSKPSGFSIPEHLRSAGDPGSYIVQSRGPVDKTFRAALAAAGATIVAYIPNNAFLVRASAANVSQLSAGGYPVLPYEPVYKLKSALLGLALDQVPLEPGTKLNVMAFADARGELAAELERRGMTVLGETGSPFGPVFTVQLREGEVWTELARLASVEIIEMASARMAANDLSRPRLAVATDSQTPDNYLGLTGTNVLVNLNDSGVSMDHPDLVNRVFPEFPFLGTDNNGHGTFVAGIIAGDGTQSLTVTNARGSINPGTNFQYRGKAPGAKLYVQSSDSSDRSLQQGAALTNALISNNSWNYGVNTYDIAASSYDAAVRDALPGVTGSQPVLFVFSAGNVAKGEEFGEGGFAETVLSPATAKNVITVGATELPRDITNVVTKITGTVTNKTTPWKGITSSGSEVAGFSSRGNVGIGVEGEFGRFKPDVVAPGTFVVSTRSTTWDEKAYYNPTSHVIGTFQDIVVQPNASFTNSIFLPSRAVGFSLQLIPNQDSPVPFPDLPIFVRRDAVPFPLTTAEFVRTNAVFVPPDGGGVGANVDQYWHYIVRNVTTQDVSFDLVTDTALTNALGDYYEVLSNLNNSISGLPPYYYRYESGTSMSAGDASGTLALMQEFFQFSPQMPTRVTNSPAMMKALLINGARTLGVPYDYQVQNSINYQGWGLIKLANSLPGSLTNNVGGLNTVSNSMFLFDQSPTNALATGQSQTWRISVNEFGQTFPLRITLVWTDPPGNPAASVKLVNDLDLIVTNLDTGEIFFGNDIPVNSTFTFPWDTNALPNIDFVNNVENAYLAPTLGTNYAITVFARRVNVNAVYAQTNDVVQDFALVISSGNGEVADALHLESVAPVSFTNAIRYPEVTVVTNQFAGNPTVGGGILLDQLVGANTPLLGTTNGMTNQWHFYMITNDVGFTNAGFVTFLPPTHSLPRAGVYEDTLNNATRVQADIDLYVSQDFNLTNLSPSAVAAADKSRTRGGTEFVAYTNSTAGAVYYIGVKSEDQMASEYAFFAGFSLLPFSEGDGNGNWIVNGFPLPSVIPDGSPSDPGASLVLGLAIQPALIRRLIVTNSLYHENPGDLISTLSHDQKFAVLANHRGDLPGQYTFVYEDNDEEPDNLTYRHPDGPGKLRDFVGEQATGVWLFSTVDDSQSATGSVNGLKILIEPSDTTGGTTNVVRSRSFFYEFVDVPVGATNLQICVNIVSANPQAMELYVRYEAFPTRLAYDHFLNINPPGACLDITPFDLPPLRPGRYFIGVYNPAGFSQEVTIQTTVKVDPRGVVPINWNGAGYQPLLDDAITNFSTFVTNRARIAQLEVGLRIDHPRVSDLAVTLISPRGTRVLLVENRGGTTTDGFGSTLSVTNVVPVSTNGGPATVSTDIDTGATVGSLTIDYNFFDVPDQMTVYYEGSPLLNTGMITGAGRFTVNYGPGSSTIVTIIMNEFGNAATNTAWNYTVSSINNIQNYLVFTDNTNRTTTPIKFAAPPFAQPATVTNLPISDFEPPLTAPGNYAAPQIVDGWQVQTTNQVTVTNNPPANTGVQSLALRAGQIERTLATTPGRSYRLNFAYRQQLQTVPSKLINIDFGAGPINGPSPKVGPAAVGQVGDFWNFYSRGDTVWRANGALVNLRQANSVVTSVGVTVIDAEGAWFNGSLDPMYNTYLYPLPNSPTTPLTMTITNLPVGQFDIYVYSHNGNYVLTSGSINYGNRTTYELSPGGTTPVWQQGVQYALYPGVVVTNSGQPVTIVARPGIGDVAMIAGLQILETTPVSQPGALIYVPGQVTNSFLGTTNWQPGGLVFTALTNSTPVDLSPVSSNGNSGVLVDSFTLTDAAGPRYVLGEESLDVLRGENAFGLWQLEIWDSRTGKTNNVSLVDWQLQFVFIPNSPSARRLAPCGPVTTQIPPGQILYYTVDVPAPARFATNWLFNASGPLNFYFNQSAPPNPDGVGVGDIIFATAVTNYTQITSANPTGYPPPPLLPGRRYYLAIENKGATNVSYTLQVCFDLSFIPPSITLTNGDAYCATNPTSLGLDYYLYTVSSNAVRAQFEINNPSGDMTLLVRRGLPPTFAVFDYFSANPFTNDEVVTVFDFSSPVPLTPGDWYLAAANLSSGPVTYCIKAMEWPVYGTNIVITNWFLGTNSFCLTWTSLPGVHYVVEGVTNLTSTNWVTVSPTITAPAYSTTYCVPLPSPFQFFRVREGISLNPFVPQPVITRIDHLFNGFLISWSGPVDAQYQVQWTPTLVTPPPLVWNTFTNPPTVTSVTGLFQFLDNGSETGGLGPMRFYRLLLLP